MERITTIITTYNHKDFIGEAIESALGQVGNFVHTILIADDASTDGTREVVRQYAQKYPSVIRDISPDVNLGISGNMRRAFGMVEDEPEKSMVSVIVPTRDHADDLRRCLESVFRLTTYPSYEIVIRSGRHRRLPFPLSKILGGWYCLRDNGWRYTLRRGRSKIGKMVKACATECPCATSDGVAAADRRCG